jgi:hypothetical protein
MPLYLLPVNLMLVGGRWLRWMPIVRHMSIHLWLACFRGLVLNNLKFLTSCICHAMRVRQSNHRMFGRRFHRLLVRMHTM